MWRKAVFLLCCIHYIICQKITPIPTSLIQAGVSLYWDHCTQSVYFVDFLALGQNMSVFRYDFNEKLLYSAYIEGESTPIYFYPIKDCHQYKDLFVVGLANATKIVKWNKRSDVARVVDTLFTVQPENPDGRLGIGRVSPHGFLYAGTFTYRFCSGPSNASFYSYTKQKRLQRIFGDVVSTTGIAFDTNVNKLYHLESCTRLITAFDIDPDTGDICNGQVVFDFNREPALLDFLPLGLEADTDGMLYIPNYYNGSIAKIDPSKSALVGIINLPVKSVASVAFGGPHNNILFAVAGSMSINITTGQPMSIENPGNSFLYMITGLGAEGRKFKRLEI